MRNFGVFLGTSFVLIHFAKLPFAPVQWLCVKSKVSLFRRSKKLIFNWTKSPTNLIFWQYTISKWAIPQFQCYLHSSCWLFFWHNTSFWSFLISDGSAIFNTFQYKKKCYVNLIYKFHHRANTYWIDNNVLSQLKTGDSKQ